MKTTVEPLEGNKVKLSVEVDEVEFDKAMDAAFRRIAREVRIPGFRPGKAPRRLLEARIGTEVAREEALRESLPEYLAAAVREHAVDVIAPPEIDITSGREEGPVVFDAVVEVRPRVLVGGYASLRVEIPNPRPSEQDIDAQVDRLRRQFGELVVVDRPAADHDHASIDIAGSRHGEAIEGLNATDYLYEVGSGGVGPELDDHLRGAKVGDILEFQAAHPDLDEEPIEFRVLVKDVKAQVLPEPTDEWAAEASEFSTIAELRADLARRMGVVRAIQAQMALREKAAAALAELVDEELPEALVNDELRVQLRHLAMRLEAQGMTIEQYLDVTGRGQADLVEELRSVAANAVRADLALRAVAEAEAIEVDDTDVDAEIERIARSLRQKAPQVRKQFERNDRMPEVRSDLRKRKALEWVVDHVEAVDPDGHVIDRADLIPSVESADGKDEGSETAPQPETETESEPE